MYRFVVAVEIAAPPARVWRALCDPTEVVRWDSGVVEAIDAPPDYPKPGQHVRWRYRGGLFRLLHDRPREVVPERSLRSRLSVGPFRFDETYTLEPQVDRCHLTAELEVHSPPPLLGPAIERLYIGPQSRAAVEASMQQLKRHCEGRA